MPIATELVRAARPRPVGLRVQRIPRAVSLDQGSPFRISGKAERDDMAITWPWLPYGRVVGVVWLLMSIAPAFVGARPPIPALGIGVLLVVPLLAFVYAAAAFCLNSTRVTLAGNVLSVEHGPLPWPGRRRRNVEGVTQLFVQQQRRTRRQPDYELWALTSDGRAAALVERSEHDVVAFLEQELEGLLGIADQPVAGEFVAR